MEFFNAMLTLCSPLSFLVCTTYRCADKPTYILMLLAFLVHVSTLLKLRSGRPPRSRWPCSISPRSSRTVSMRSHLRLIYYRARSGMLHILSCSAPIWIGTLAATPNPSSILYTSPCESHGAHSAGCQLLSTSR